MAKAGRVTGIGGLFFRARDPEALTAWYRDNLGVAEIGQWRQDEGPTVFAPFPADTDYWGAGRQWMLNLRVDALDPLLDRLRAAGVEVIRKDDWDTPGIGRFARIHDPEGNPVELWEPAPEAR
ncbi:VOC family protein [Rhodobacteraceae bacterium CCMM004]|nr:VOC family protein [Rhodobacteraceae bacterium CCMM004]